MKNVVTNERSFALTQKQWAAVPAVGLAGFAVGGPVGAAAAMAGAVAGASVANKLGWPDAGASNPT